MEPFATDTPVLVTGATGYVAGWIVKALLERGYTVHAPVRDPSNAKRRAHLDQLAAASPGTIEYFAADLLEDGSYREAMAGCQLVFHTASPFKLAVKDADKELVEPAKLGTRNVLEEVNRTASVRRVVLTSSCAAIYGDNADVAKAPGGVLTEEVWNTSSSLVQQPYSYSKTVAEQEAWDISKKQDRWDLVVMNPSMVFGPGVDPHGTSESFHLFKQFGDGTLKAGVPDIGMGVVDVRDLAEAHLRAAFTPTASGRYIVSGQDSSMPEIARTLIERYGDDYPIPRRTLPKWLVWLVGPLADKSLTRGFVSRNVGHLWKADNEKGVRELGLSYRPLAETTNDFFQQMIDHQLIARR